MGLPTPLKRARSLLAGGAAFLVRLAWPLLLRVGWFLNEAWARARIRGVIAPGVQFFGPVAVEGTGRIHIGAGARIGRRVYFETQGAAEIRIGARVVINDGVLLTAHEGIVIGDDTMIGEYVSIRDANHGMLRGTPIRRQPHDAASIAVGANVWIGRGAIVMKGVSLADEAVVGANSVVNKSVEPGIIVAGAPARPVRERPGA